MTNEEAIKMLKAKLECMNRQTRGIFEECNPDLCDDCDLNYDQGNMGAQKETLRMAIKALEDQKTGRWIPIKTRPLTREEFEQYGGESGCEVEFAYDCPIPEDGEEVLITTDSGSVEMDTFYRDSQDGCFFESYYGEHDIVAWMPLPEPYKADKEADNEDRD